MPKQQNKTQKTSQSPTTFLNSIEDPQKRKDAKEVLKMMKEITKLKPFMWGESIIGFGEYTYKRRDGSVHKFFLTGFSPRKQNISLYVMPGFNNYQDELQKLGKHKTSVSCLYIKKLDDVDMKVLKRLIKKGFVEMKKRSKKVVEY